ncbi:MAG: chitobiase/beta-hexosaminidase C-terminal domain-containing protein [Spirochaetaceae bacterium]|nr:chitobiase/beta-hexosaminidase C-terminal domain-containing protein [Spirochaetaceae bacterium]
MKKLIYVLLMLFALSIVLVSCGGGGGGGTAPATTDSSSTTTSTTTTTTSTSSTSTSTTTPTPTPVATLTAPTIQVPTGKALLSGSKIGITSSVAGATIYYTLDGTDPTSSSSVYNASKVTINSACTLKAIAIKDGASSSVASATYSIAVRKNAPDAVNDIVFKNGTAVAYSADLYFTDEVKADAVAMIFYKGAECSNDSSTIRTLGVGLKCSPSYMKWCLNTANGYSTNITTIQCTPSGSAGTYTFTGDKYGSDNLSQIATFLAGNGSSDDTVTAENYPAFYWAKNYGTANGCTGVYANEWYLPTIAELYQIYNIKTNIDAAVALCGLTDAFSNTVFWSSSQYASCNNYAVESIFLVAAYDPSTYDSSKNGNRRVCAIRAFN